MGMVGQKKSFAARRAYLQTRPTNQSMQCEALFGIGPVAMACGARANVSGPGSL